MLLELLISLMFSLQSASGATFEVDLWPGEGHPVFEAVAPQLQLHELPSESSSVVETIRTRPGQRLAFNDTRYRTMRPGRFVVSASTRITGRRLGELSHLSRSDYYSGKFSPASLPVIGGDTIEYLQYRAEGTCFVRILNSVIDADPCPTEKEGEFRLEAKPTLEWWIHVMLDGTPRGWLLVTDATARVVDREG